ncbi:MAG: hypothetical protein J5496_06180, partial [Lachnospiraceae bacterium]|nr:hypothetical protein [Lachnospiraceae bacterium]
GTIYITSSGDKLSKVVLENVTMSGNSCAFEGQDIYLANKGILEMKNCSIQSGSGNRTAIYRAGASSQLTLDGKCTASIYTPAAVALADSFSAESQIDLYLDAYTDGKVVLTGTDAVVEASLLAFTLPELTDDLQLALQLVAGTGAVLVSTETEP